MQGKLVSTVSCVLLKKSHLTNMSHLWEKHKIQREVQHKNTWPNSLGGKKWDFSHCFSLRGNIKQNLRLLLQ